MGCGNSLVSRFPAPLQCLSIVLRNTFTKKIHGTQHALRHGITLIRRLFIQYQCLSIVLWYTLTVKIHVPQGEQRSGMTLVSSLPIPFYRLSKILRNALTKFIHNSKVVLGLGIPFFCKGFQFMQCSFVICIFESFIVVSFGHTEKYKE